MSGWLEERVGVTPSSSSPSPSAAAPGNQAGVPAGWMSSAPASEAPQAMVVKAERIAVTSGKGGAGKTATATTLAALLVRRFQGLRVVLVDCDVAYGQLASTLGLAPRNTWASIAALRPEQITPQTIGGMLDQHPVGFHVLPSAGGVAALSVTPDVAERTLTALAAAFDVVICDCSDHLDDAATTAAIRTASRLLIVTPPDPPAVEAGTRFVDLLIQSGLFDRERTSVVLNRVAKFHDVRAVREAIEAKGETIWDGWGIPVIAEVPDDPAAAEARARKTISILAKPGAPSSKALERVVECLVPAAKAAKGGGFLGRLFGK